MRFLGKPAANRKPILRRAFSALQWHCLSGHVIREHDRLAAHSPDSPRIRPTLPRISLLGDLPPHRRRRP